MFKNDISALKNHAVIFSPTIDRMMTMGERVLLARRTSRLTQKELARRAGVSRSHVANIENERVTNVGVEVIEDLARALEVSTLYLLGETDDPLAGIEDEESDRDSLNAADAELLRLARQMDEEQKHGLLAMARLILRPIKPRIIE